MSRVIHFEITANDPEKVIQFYREVLDWKIQKWGGPVDYWLVSTGDPASPGIDGGIFRPREHFVGTINSVQVDDIEAVMAKVKANGGQVVTEKDVIPGVGYQVYCKDVEGTLFGLHQEDRQAGLG
jgi:predicted enzyme related to lactoylglutathione lyase